MCIPSNHILGQFPIKQESLDKVKLHYSFEKSLIENHMKITYTVVDYEKECLVSYEFPED